MTPPPKEDPWEARERQREKWRRSAERRTGSRPPRSPNHTDKANTRGGSKDDSLWDDLTGGERGLREDYVVWGILAVVGTLLLSEVPTFAGLAREQMARIATGLLLLLLGSVRGVQDDLRTALRRGPNPAILLLAAWAVFETVRAPFHGFAITELLRVLDGVGAYFLCAYCLKAPRQTGIVAVGLIAMGVVLSLYDISRNNRHTMADHLNTHGASFLGTHETAGSLLVLLLPLALAFAVSTGIEEKRRLAAIGASLVLGVAELLARTRSAWLGGLVALTVLAILSLRFPNDDPDGARTPGAKSRSSARSRRRTPLELLASPAALIAVTMFLFLTIAGAAPFVLHRFVSIQSALQDASFAGRVEMWSGAARMAAERPALGWGLGTYPIIEGDWTHQGVDKAEALQRGIGNDNIAHDYYLQWAADTGGVGLALYVGTLALFFAAACRALPRVTAPPQRALLCGCIATVAGAVVDGIGAPSYNFHGVSTVLWCAMGLGVAALRPLPSTRAAKGEATGPALGPLPIPLYGLAVFLAVGSAVAVVASGKAIVRSGAHLPPGRLELSVTPARAVPGDKLRWTAFFHDGSNVEHTTAAGTLWHASSTEGGANQSILQNLKPTLDEVTETDPARTRHGILQLIAPALAPDTQGNPPQLTMHARYRDTYGRWYDADSVVTVQVLSKSP